MANVYVRSGAGGAGTGADWANAYTTLSAALTAKAAGDDFWVSEDHAESTAGAVTLTSPGTAASPCRIICVNHSGTVPPVSADLRTTATVTTTGANSLNFAGMAYVYGIIFNAGSTGGSMQFTATTPWWWRLEACALRVGSNNSGGRFFVGGTTTNADDSLLELVNTTVQFGNAGQGITVRAPFRWLNTASAITSGTLPTTLFLQAANSAPYGWAEVVGVDLSALASGKSLVDVSVACFAKHLFMDCKLGSSVSVTTGSVAGQGGTEVRLINCDSANTNYRYYRQTYQGTITQETTIVRSGGASDGTTTVSRKMVTTANSKLYSPLESDPMVVWNETTGSSVTVTIPVLTDNVTLTNADAWIEVEYLGTASFPLGNYVNDRVADILASGTNQTTDGTSSWTTTGLTTPVKQSLAVTFTPQVKGPFRVRVMLAKVSTTMYFDPKPIIT